MDKASIIGIISGAIIVLLFSLGGSSAKTFINPTSFLIVIGGTLASTFLSFKMADIKSAVKAIPHVFKDDEEDPNTIIKACLHLSKISRKDGMNKLKPFRSASFLIEKAINLMSESPKKDRFESSMRIEIEALKIRHYRIQNVFRKMGTYAPAFGMLGTVIGLIKMLSRLNDPTTIGPAMAVALITTLYGSILSTMLFLPIANKLQERTANEVLNIEILTEAGLAIIDEHHPIMIYDKVTAFISPEKRKPMNVSLVN